MKQIFLIILLSTPLFSIDSKAIKSSFRYNSIYFLNDHYGWITGSRYLFTPKGNVVENVLLRTNDGGNNWNKAYINCTLNETYFFSEIQGIGRGPQNVFYTYDGGLSWFPADTTTISLCRYWFEDINFFNFNIGWAIVDIVCDDFFESSQAIVHTINGGKNWNNQFIGNPFPIWSEIIFIDDKFGLAYGWRYDVEYSIVSEIYITSNSGEIWNRKCELNDIEILDVFVADSLTIWILTSNRITRQCEILNSKDGGSDWEVKYKNKNIDLYKIIVNDSNSIWVFGSNVLRSFDNGIKWIITNNTLPLIFNSYALNSNTAFAVVKDSVIIKTSDGGFNWKVVNQIKTNIKKHKDYELSAIIQNYPNPFNECTQFHLRIQTSCYVTLKIYNIVGEEIDVLIDDYKQAGDYRINWNPSDITSGIYIYYLGYGKYKIKKKLLVVR